MAFNFYGREEELNELERLFEQTQNDCSRMVVVTGRRRVGKTTLINHAFENKDIPYLYFMVNDQLSEKRNCEIFWETNAEKLNLHHYPIQIETISALFAFLMQLAQGRPLVLAIDEFQRFEKVAPYFFGELQRQWDQNRQKSNMLLVLSGSVASAMHQIFESGNAPLFGRTDAFFRIQPFTIETQRKILHDFNPNYDSEDLLTLYMLTGGVAKYVQALMEAGAVTHHSMIECSTKMNSVFVTDATIMLVAEFKSDFNTYFSILELIANGITERNALVNHFAGEINIGGHLTRLEDFFKVIQRAQPLNTNNQYRKVRYVLNDNFLSYWFAFLYPYAELLEGPSRHAVTRRIFERYNDYSGRVLEQFMRQKFLESGLYLNVGFWWDRSGNNELDLIAVDDFNKEIVFAEIKRNKNKVDIKTLQNRAQHFLEQNTKYKKFKPKYIALGLDDC